MRKKRAPADAIKMRKKSQEQYRHKVRRFTFQFSLKDTEVQEWFECQSDKGDYLKNLILEDKRRHLEQSHETYPSDAIGGFSGCSYEELMQRHKPATKKACRKNEPER
ncbi:MAG: hypothetical protein PHY23_06990 [Oscillospiraceae bacterium]|nr:hypothetical protein [Oscillospiraceae bacterium]